MYSCFFRDVMQGQHVDPAEAVQIHQDLKAKQSVAIHWGTFALAYEVGVSICTVSYWRIDLMSVWFKATVCVFYHRVSVQPAVRDDVEFIWTVLLVREGWIVVAQRAAVCHWSHTGALEPERVLER